jgi:hypothetical protein
MYGLNGKDVNLANGYVRVKRGTNGEPRYVRLNAVVTCQVISDQLKLERMAP